MDKEQLDLVPMEDIFDAICRRTDGCLLVWQTKRTDHEHDAFVSYDGGLTLAIGLAERSKDLMRHRFREVDEE